MLLEDGESADAVPSAAKGPSDIAGAMRIGAAVKAEAAPAKAAPAAAIAAPAASGARVFASPLAKRIAAQRDRQFPRLVGHRPARPYCQSYVQNATG